MCLHNWLRQQTSPIPYIQSDLVDTENGDGTVSTGSWRNDMTDNITSLKTNSFNSTKKAKEVRDTFANYFNSDGAVPWQMERI